MRFGVVGLGAWGSRVLPRLSELVDVVAVNTTRPVEFVAQRVPSAQVFSNFQRFLDCGSMDAVYIATPPETHAQLVSEAIRAGKHVLVEKPLGVSSSEASACSDQARSAGLVLACGYIYLHSSCFQYLSSSSPMPSRLSLRWLKTGSFRDTLDFTLQSHELALATRFFKGQQAKVEDSRGDRDTKIVTLRFESGVATIITSRLSSTRHKSMLVQSEGLSREWSEDQVKELDRERGVWSSVHQERADLIHAQFIDFIEAIRNQRQPLVSGRDSIEVHRLMEMIRT